MQEIDGEGSLEIRLLKRRDIEFGMELKGLAGWNQTRSDWERLLRLQPRGCFLAKLNGEKVGTVTTLSYGEVGWVGMLLVHPAKRRKGVGTALLRRGIKHLRSRGVEVIKLDATPEGRKMYKRLGFVDEYMVCRYRSELGKVREAVKKDDLTRREIKIRPISEKELGEIVFFDEKTLGVSRGNVLRELVRENGGYCLCTRDGQNLLGYIMARAGSGAWQVGPLVAQDFESAGGLLREVVKRVPQEEEFVVVDVPSPNLGANSLVKNESFKVERRFHRMSLGSDGYIEDLGKIFAISGPEKG